MGKEPRFDLSAEDERLKDLQPQLGEIIANELAAGNSIDWIQVGGWSEIDLCVTLKFPFSQHYDLAGLQFYRNEDRHYPLNESYLAKTARQAVEAPY